jgi:RNA polymerase sigma-70 factor (ECF subfamily)
MGAMSEPISAPSSPSSAGETSLSLLARASANDAEGWRKLVQLYSPLVFFWGRRLGLDREDAADLVQNVWSAVAAHIGQFRHQGGAFRGWLWTIARNKVADHFRKGKAEPAAAGGTDARKFIETVPEREPLDETGVEESQLLHRALEQIRPEFEERTWRAFWRMTVDGQTAADVGQELGLAANAVHQAKFRVLRRLREEMAGLVEA